MVLMTHPRSIAQGGARASIPAGAGTRRGICVGQNPLLVVNGVCSYTVTLHQGKPGYVPALVS